MNSPNFGIPNLGICYGLKKSPNFGEFFWSSFNCTKTTMNILNLRNQSNEDVKRSPHAKALSPLITPFFVELGNRLIFEILTHFKNYAYFLHQKIFLKISNRACAFSLS